MKTTIGPGDSFEDAYTILRPGDTLLLEEGSYWGRELTNPLPEQGTADNPITIAAAPGAYVVLTPYAGSRDQVWAISEHGLVLEGLTFDGRTGGRQYGLKLCEGAKHIVVRNCRFVNFRVNYVKLIGVLGDDAASGDVLFDDCEFWEDEDTPRENIGRFFDAVNFSGVTIRDCLFRDSYHKAMNGAIVLKGGSNNCVVEDCLFERISQPDSHVSWPHCVVSIGGESTPGLWAGGHESVGTIVRNCEFVKCGNGAILFFSAKDCVAAGNTIECGGNYAIGLHGPGNDVALNCEGNSILGNTIVYTGASPEPIRIYQDQGADTTICVNTQNGVDLPEMGSCGSNEPEPEPEPEPDPVDARYCPFQPAWTECIECGCIAWRQDNAFGGYCQRL